MTTSLSSSGDVVGNGRIVIDDFNWGGSNSNLYLNKEERQRRNGEFDYILDHLDLNPYSSGTGDVVGNGGGFLESHLSYFLHILDRHLYSALSQDAVKFDEFEKRVITQILYELPKMRPDKLRFITGKKAKVLFFIPGVDQAPRIAKTGFSPEYPIYLNTELIYKESRGSDHLLLSILVHELGHQVGVADHGLLDNLAAKVVQVAELNSEKIRTRLALGDLTVTIHNHLHQSAPSNVYLYYGETSVKPLEWNLAQLRTVCRGDYIYSAVVYNLHWSSRQTGMDSGVFLEAKGWLDVECMHRGNGSFYKRDRNLEISIAVKGEEVLGSMKITK